jgi:phage/plasmid-associated DNA primase
VQTEVLKTLQHHVRFDFFKEQEKIKHLLCCPNGVVDLRTGELLGKPTPDQCFTQLCATKYDPDADTRPAIDFFGHAFPVEAYPDSTDLVVYMQQFGGYSLTLETNLQSCLFVYGKGSNAKSIWMRMFADVWGKPMQCTIPIESLSKARGTNNDSLTDAMQSRLVVLSESNGKAKIDIGTFNALVCGEETTCKKMYKTETNYDPRMKFISMLNDPPDFPPGAFHIERRCGSTPEQDLL